MRSTDRFYRIDQLLHDRGVVSFQTLMDELEVSRATLRRDLTHLRDRLNAPIVYDRDADGYRYGPQGPGPRFQLPGLWFSAEEALALITMNHLLASMDTGGLLGPQIQPLMARLNAILDASPGGAATEVLKRVRLMPAMQRKTNSKWFQVIGAALVHRKRLSIRYFTRSRNERSEREVSPQRLMYYRNNWYLDAWCHKSNDIRMFSLDAIEAAAMLETRAKEVSLARVDAEIGSGYGIYRKASKVRLARLKFNAAAAVWVRDEVWHEQQVLEEQADGGVILTVPYSMENELLMDVLRHGENVVVLEPQELVEKVRQRLVLALKAY
jgi:predicted DNA-binding transcriptional regulator YafY